MSEMTRDELINLCQANNVKFTPNTALKTLYKRLVEAGVVVEEDVDVERVEVDESTHAECIVLLPNLWTSDGKYFQKESVVLPIEEAKTLEKTGKVVIR